MHFGRCSAGLRFGGDGETCPTCIGSYMCMRASSSYKLVREVEKHFHFYCDYYATFGANVPLLSTHQDRRIISFQGAFEDEGACTHLL